MSNHYPPPETAGPLQAYNSNISIPGAVLFSAFVVFFIILFLLACCCAARFSALRHELANAADAATEDTGLRPDIVKNLPVFFYNSSSSSSTAADGRNKLECAVCLEEFKEGEEGRRLPGCKHSFHVECIDMWLSSHSTCPICRSIVKAEDIRKDSLDLVIRT